MANDESKKQIALKIEFVELLRNEISETKNPKEKVSLIDKAIHIYKQLIINKDHITASQQVSLVRDIVALYREKIDQLKDTEERKQTYKELREFMQDKFAI